MFWDFPIRTWIQLKYHKSQYLSDFRNRTDYECRAKIIRDISNGFRNPSNIEIYGLHSIWRRQKWFRHINRDNCGIFGFIAIYLNIAFIINLTAAIVGITNKSRIMWIFGIWSKYSFYRNIWTGKSSEEILGFILNCQSGRSQTTSVP